MEKQKVYSLKDLPKDEEINLVHTGVIPFLDGGPKEWRVIYPTKNKDGSRNWMNFLFGGYGNLVRLIIYAILAIMIFYGVLTLLDSCSQLAANPCDYCYQRVSDFQGVINFPGLNEVGNSVG